ncbi:MAG: cyclic nucleotide-binding domain-containing protein [Chloroflexi bacterium]|nr:cyclic nucleotide-binding domain-containing protein [Chloroflexota bacterium]
MKHKQVLRLSVVFEELKEAQVDKIMCLCQAEEYEAGGTIFSEKSPAKNLYVLEKGKVALQMHRLVEPGQLGGRVTVDIVAPSEVFGWSAVVEAHPYTLTAVCLEPTEVLAIDGARLRALMAEDHDIGYLMFRRLIRVVACRLDEARQLLVSERMQASYA